MSRRARPCSGSGGKARLATPRLPQRSRRSTRRRPPWPRTGPAPPARPFPGRRSIACTAIPLVSERSLTIMRLLRACKHVNSPGRRTVRRTGPREARMDAEDWLPWLGIGLLASFIVAIETMFRSRRTAEALRDLREKVFLLEHRLLRPDERLQTAGPAPAPEMPPPEIVGPEPIAEPQQPTVEPAAAPEPPTPPTPTPALAPSDGRRL